MWARPRVKLGSDTLFAVKVVKIARATSCNAWAANMNGVMYGKTKGNESETENSVGPNL